MDLLLIDYRLAAGVSYTWDEGPDALNKYPAPWVGVRKVGDEVKVCHYPLPLRPELTASQPRTK